MARTAARSLAALTLLATLAVATLAVAQATGPSDPGPVPGTGRLAGETRIGTAVQISQRAFPGGAQVAYLANAEEPVDAVAGGSLTDGPVLLVPTCDLPAGVADELSRLAPTEVLALGGTAAICDDVLVAAATAAGIDGGVGGDGDLPDFVVSASAEVVDVSSAPPFTVEGTDPGVLFEGGTFTHAVLLTGDGDDVVLDDPRFSEFLRDGEGQLAVSGRGCSPSVIDGEPGMNCQDDFRYLLVADGETTEQTLTLHTDDAEVGPVPVQAGTYVLDQPVRWDITTDPLAGDVAFNDGSATIRVTYVVERPGDIPDDAVVTWETPSGAFRTSGHPAADLARIAEGVAAGEPVGIPNGVLRRGDGGVNLGRDWHLVDIEVVDVAIEICDGTADYVSDHLEDYLRIGRYCPWGAVPIAIDD